MQQAALLNGFGIDLFPWFLDGFSLAETDFGGGHTAVASFLLVASWKPGRKPSKPKDIRPSHEVDANLKVVPKSRSRDCWTLPSNIDSMVNSCEMVSHDPRPCVGRNEVYGDPLVEPDRWRAHPGFCVGLRAHDLDCLKQEVNEPDGAFAVGRR